MEPVRLEILLDDKTLKGMRSVEGNLSGIGLYAKQVIAQLEQELLELQKQYRKAMAAGTNTDAQMADIQALQGVVRQLKTELLGLEEQKKKTGSTPLMKDDPAPKLNNVRMSMQQIARELPSLAMGPQMFFLAISNNIPMFTDALASARKEYEALTDAGKKATPVWKQVLSSLFSWQTALAALITLSVVYGKEIGGWVKSLFGVKDAALSAAKAQEKVNESFRNSSSDVAEQVTIVRSLSERWKELGDNMADKKQFITENKKEFGKLGVEVGNVNDAENLLVDNTDVFIGAMILRAEAAAAFKLATEQTEKALKKQNEIEERRKKGPTFWDKFRANFFSSASGSATYTRQADTPTAEQLSKNAISALEEEQKAAEDTAKSYMDLFLARTKEWKERLKSAGIKEDNGRKTKDTGKSARDYQDELADARIRAQQKLEAARISVMREGVRKRQALARQELDESLAQIDKEERDTLKKMDEAEKKRGVKSTPEERQAVKDNASQQRALATMGYLKESYDIEKEFRDRNLREWVEYYKEYGTYQEKRAALDKEYNHKIGQLYEERRKAEAEGDAAGAESLDLQIARATRDKGKELIKLDYKQLTESPDYIRAFENLRETSTGTLNSLLEQFEKAKQAAAQVLSPDELREYTTTIREIMDELDSRNPFQALADRKSELAEAERELAEARRNLETVNAGGRVSTGVRYNDRTGKMEETYLTAAAAMEKYNKAQDKVARSSSRVEKAEKEAADIVGELARAVEELGGAIGGQAGEIVTLMGDIALFTLTTINGLDKVAQTGANAISAVEKASVILTIISAAIQLFQKISELGNNRAFRQYEVYAEKIKEINALTDAVNEYRIAALEAQQAESNWFSADNLKNLRDYRALHDEVAKAYADKAMESQAIYRNESGGGWLTGALNWVMGNLSALAWWDEWRDIWGQGDYKEGQTAAINNLRIETRKKSSGFLGTGIGGKSQKTEDLVTWARNQGLGELFDDEGLINKELAQSLIDNYGDKLVGQTKETLEALIELREKYDEYIEQLHEYVSSLYEPLTENFVDSLWDWFDNGKDALDSFKDYASDTFRDIVSDMMRTIVLDKVVGSFGDDIAALYEEYAKGKIDEAELMRKVAERTEELVGKYQDSIPGLQNIMDLVGGYLKDAGIDIKQPEGSSQSGRAGTVTSMTEETAGRLEGIGNATLDHVISIDNNLTRHLEGMATSLGKIAGNSEYLRHLETINENIAELRRGVKLKT